VILFGVQDDEIDFPFEIDGAADLDEDSKTSLCENSK